MSLSNARVVLVRPAFAGNVGSIARVMRNMGLRELALVSPQADLADRDARKLSTHGEEILDQARIVAELGDAVSDCVWVVGTTARTGGVYRQSVAPPDVAARELAQMLERGPAAIVFGNETNGLTNTEIGQCQALVTVPTDPDYPALNLAQSAAICLYELRRAWLAREGTPVAPSEPPAPFADQERMFGRLREALQQIQFLRGANADTLMFALRHLIGRAKPTATEVDILFGLARQIRWFVSRHAPSSTLPDSEKPDGTSPRS